MYRVLWRTVKPLEPLTVPGCDNPTSRCQAIPSIGSLENNKPVIPDVPFIRWAIIIFTQNYRITITDVSPCLNGCSYSQANIYYCALKLVLLQFKLTIAQLWYSLKAHRPSQTTYYPLSNCVRIKKFLKSGISLTFIL